MSISLYSKHLKEYIDRKKIYYGKCKVYYKRYPDKNSDKEAKEIKRYYLQLLNNQTNKLICSIAVSPKVFDYLKLDLSDEVGNDKIYCVCLFTEFKVKNGYLNTTLKDSRMSLFE